ncbi:MAG: ATP-binding cassette domain-containing protein [Defluviitaleaceae bacterium]|nr:ATP-binding cassette domain-containing protein [Defluviitaleaceae bacterium]
MRDIKTLLVEDDEHILNSVAAFLEEEGYSVDTCNKKDFAMKILADMGIDEKIATRKVTNLSGGQRQRVGIARVLCNYRNAFR